MSRDHRVPKILRRFIFYFWSHTRNLPNGPRDIRETRSSAIVSYGALIMQAQRILIAGVLVWRKCIGENSICSNMLGKFISNNDACLAF